MKSWMDTTIAASLGLSILSVAALPAAAQSGDASRGQRVFNQQCRACHTLDKGGAQTAGPNLHGLFGRKIASVEGFSFSPALRELSIIWTPETLSALFEQGPESYTPGSRMPDQRIADPEDRAALAEYLAQFAP